MFSSNERRGDSRTDPARGLTCPMPIRGHDRVVLGHGGGGQLSQELIERLFLPAFGNDYLRALGDSAVVQAGDHKLAVTTDSYVVRPLFFPGGCIGDLAINGTINDLAMVGAVPLYLTVGLILEEGLAMEVLHRVIGIMADAARSVGVPVVAGDTKVVERGHGDGLYINTSGVGLLESERIGPSQARPGDVVLVSGTLGDHGMAVMSVREGLEFDAAIESDTAPLHEMVAAMLTVCPEIHVLRDPTRGGLAASLNEIAAASGCGIEIFEDRVPVKDTVAAACEMLGLDPLLIANEGKLVCIAPPEFEQPLLAAMRSHRVGAEAAAIGHVVEGPSGVVTARTAIGARRVVSLPQGELLPRIC